MSKQIIEINGTALAYRESGSGAPVVLVHANLSDMRSWEFLEPHLADNFRVINYSRRFAYPNETISDGVDDPLSKHADDLIALIEKLQLKKVHLVGNSSGAFICLLAAKQRPDLVRTLTLEEPPVISLFFKKLPPTPIEALKLLLTSPATFLALVKFGAGTIGPATKAFQSGDDTAGLNCFALGVLGQAAYAKISTARRRQMTDNVRAHRAALLGVGLPVFTPRDAEDVLTPVMLIGGDETPSFQRKINQQLATLIPGARSIYIPDASHFAHEDDPKAVAVAIRDFCMEHAH
jgi:pimeloyl-ACP methyl ester carboxylesterase